MIKNLENICKQYGTPIYIYDEKIIKEQVNNLIRTLPSNTNLLYSIKANSNINILRILKQMIYGFEICSMGELYLALQAGILAERIIFVGPAKKKEELTYAIDNNIWMIVAESENEIICINNIGKTKGKIIDISLRINPLHKFNGSHIKMGGESKQFGIDEEVIVDIYKRVSKLSNIRIRGIHCYGGTQNLDAEMIVGNMRSILSIAYKLQKDIGIIFDFIDMGGGFGIPYTLQNKCLDHNRLKVLFNELFCNDMQKFQSKCKFFVESGRFIIGPSGIFVCKIIDKKISRGKRYFITDGGTNCAPSSYSNRYLLRNNPILYGYPTNGEKKVMANIVGPMCTPTDYLAQNIMLSEDLDIGDYIVIKNAGAYGYSAAYKDFLSHPYPAEIMYEEEKVRLIRKRSTLRDMLKFY